MQFVFFLKTGIYSGHYEIYKTFPKDKSIWSFEQRLRNHYAHACSGAQIGFRPPRTAGPGWRSPDFRSKGTSGATLIRPTCTRLHAHRPWDRCRNLGRWGWGWGLGGKGSATCTQLLTSSIVKPLATLAHFFFWPLLSQKYLFTFLKLVLKFSNEVHLKVLVGGGIREKKTLQGWCR